MFFPLDLASLWEWVIAPQPVLPWWGILLALLLGFASAFHGRIWSKTRILAVYFHEAGHAVVALLTGRRLLGIRLLPDGSGSTLHEGAAFGVGRLLTAFAGYPAPAAVAWLLLYLSGTGHSRGSLAALVGLCLALLIFQRSWRGWALTGAVVVLSGIVATFDGLVPALVVTVIAGYLFVAAPRSIWELHHARKNARPGENHSDSESLSQLTGVPPVVWEIGFLALSGWLLWQAFPFVT